MAATGKTDKRTIDSRLNMLSAKGLFERRDKGLIRIQEAFSGEVVGVSKSPPKSVVRVFLQIILRIKTT